MKKPHENILSENSVKPLTFLEPFLFICPEL